MLAESSDILDLRLQHMAPDRAQAAAALKTSNGFGTSQRSCISASSGLLRLLPRPLASAFRRRLRKKIMRSSDVYVARGDNAARPKVCLQSPLGFSICGPTWSKRMLKFMRPQTRTFPCLPLTWFSRGLDLPGPESCSAAENSRPQRIELRMEPTTARRSK